MSKEDFNPLLKSDQPIVLRKGELSKHFRVLTSEEVEKLGPLSAGGETNPTRYGKLYVFGTSSFIVLKHYYRGTFESVWSGIEELAAEGSLVSTREVFNELLNYNDAEYVQTWAKNYKSIFSTPANDELEFVARIFRVAHFNALISQKAMLKGTPVADPFVIAAAAIKDGTVVTQERFKPNAAKVPNVCEHFGVRWTDLEGFMKQENWSF